MLESSGADRAVSL